MKDQLELIQKDLENLKDSIKELWDNCDKAGRLEIVSKQINTWLPLQYHNFDFCLSKFDELPDPVRLWLIKYYPTKSMDVVETTKKFNLIDFFKSVFKKTYKSNFSIEYYPISRKYFPKYKNYYLQSNYQSGIIKTLDSYCFAYADYFYTEQGASDFIELFKEHQFKKNITIIKK